MADILFVSAGPVSWGSSRMRVFWVAEALGADVLLYERIPLTPYEHFAEYDAVIFQKHGAPELQEALLNDGKQVWWDACDPMWWFSPDTVRRMVVQTSGVVCSSGPLADDYNQWIGRPIAKVIPDRLKLSHFTHMRQHREVDPVRFIWFGVAVNRIAAVGAWANLARLKANGYNVELTIFDDRPDIGWPYGNELPVYHVTWNLGQENEVLAAHDIALLPPYPGPWGKVKSNNKELTAAACGLPVTDGWDYAALLELVREPAYRQAEGEERRKEVELRYGIERSAQQWTELLNGKNSDPQSSE